MSDPTERIEAVTLAIFDRLSAAVGWADCRDAAVAALRAASIPADLTDPQIEAACEAFWESWPLEGFGPEWTEAARRNMANALNAAAASLPADPADLTKEEAFLLDVVAKRDAEVARLQDALASMTRVYHELKTGEVARLRAALDRLGVHEFEGILAGTADRPCTRCGRADRDAIHVALGEVAE